MIVKIQRPLSQTGGATPQARIYNESRSMDCVFPFSEVSMLFEDELKVYHEAKLYTSGTLDIRDRVKDQDW